MNLRKSDFPAEAQHLIYRLVKLYELCDRMCLTQHGVTAAQGYTLLALPEEGSISMKELSEAMDLAGSTMTRMVDQLVRKGLVHRRPDEEDRRVVQVGLTAQGREVQRAERKEIQQFFKIALEDIPGDEYPVILATLRKVNWAMTRALGAFAAQG